MKKFTKKSKILVLILTLSLSVIPFLGLTVSSYASNSLSDELLVSSVDYFNPRFYYTLANNHFLFYDPVKFTFGSVSVNKNSNFSFTYFSGTNNPVENYYNITRCNGSIYNGSFRCSSVSSTGVSSLSSLSLDYRMGFSTTLVDYLDFLSYPDNPTFISLSNLLTFDFGVPSRYFIYQSSIDGSTDVNHTSFTRFLVSFDYCSFVFDIFTPDSYGVSRLSPRSFLFSFADSRSVYDLGYSDGYFNAQEQFYDSRYSSGYNSGYSVGYQEGQASIELANDYTFGSLLDAVFYAPLRMLYDALNFDVMGVNFYYVFTSLFILAIVLTIIRIII